MLRHSALRSSADMAEGVSSEETDEAKRFLAETL
eukprot:COSAG06_NODE_51028_length_314_cov_2.409302_1_plen_33_part_10